MGNDNEIMKKVLIITYDDNYINQISRLIFGEDVNMIEELGFGNYEDKNKKIIYTFLSGRIKRTWMHHLTGTYGIILINEGKDIYNENNVREFENLLSCPSLNKVPIVVIYDKNQINSNKNSYYNNFKKMIENLHFKMFSLTLDFSNLISQKEQNEFLQGFNWMESEMIRISLKRK